MSFVKKLDDQEYPEGKIVIDSILNIASTMKARVVAEGVETKEQERILKELGCDIAQGFLFYKPLTLQELIELIETSLT
jgi:EAL domain-containing protein (putative c-di-GMP-specific phosphodiesterase class I)